MSANDTQKGKIFERRVANLFALLGFSVTEDVLIGGRQVDLVVEDRRGPLTAIYIVECKDQSSPVTTAQYDAFRGRLHSAKKQVNAKVRGVLVSTVGFVKEARAQNENEDDIEILSISDLETKVIDFRQYVRELLDEQQKEALPYFVEPNIRKEYLELGQSAFDFLREWMADPLSNHLTLLGDYGTGKTTLLKHLAYRSAQYYQQEVLSGGARARVPLYLDLRDYVQALSLKQIILDFLDNHSIRANSYAAFEHVLQDGQLLLILDGFDEMASRGNYGLTLRNFRELNRTAKGRAKVILSSRTHYFTTHGDVQKLHGQVVPDSFQVAGFTDLYREIAARPNFLICYLSEFEPSQVEEYLRRRCGARWSNVQQFIDSTYNLTELSRKPVLLDMIVSSEPQIQSRPETITAGVLYQVYTDIWLQRNDWSLTINATTKSRLLEHFAEMAAESSDNQVHHSQIQVIIRQWDDGIANEDVTLIDQELRTASFLVRDQDGNYRFSHRSFQEFFFARFLLSCAARNSLQQWSEGFFRTEIYRFLRDLLPTQPEALQALLVWVGSGNNHSETLIANAVKCLGGDPQNEVIQALAKLLATSPYPSVRGSAATSLTEGKTAAMGFLRSAVLSDPEPQVRLNACLALGRMRDREANDFLVGLLDDADANPYLFGGSAWVLYKGAKEFDDSRVLDALIRNARDSSGVGRNIQEACLALCSIHWTAESHSFCMRVLERSGSPKLNTVAFSLLPNEDRAPYVEKILSILRHYLHHVNFEGWLECLRGVKTSDVQDFLVKQVTTSPGSIAALGILIEDYPEVIREHGQQWMTARYPYWVRIRTAQAYARLAAPDGLQEISQLLAARERVATKIDCLRLIADLYPDHIAEVVAQHLSREKTTRVKKFALELLQSIDRPRAVELMLNSGLRDIRVGTRVAVCSILSAAPSGDVTEALLWVLQYDDSKWVRLQALRSLCAPGRVVTREQIVHASASETDRNVLGIRRELLGT